MNEFSVYSFGNCHLMGFIYIFSSFFVTERLLLTEKINFTMMAGGSAEHTMVLVPRMDLPQDLVPGSCV